MATKPNDAPEEGEIDLSAENGTDELEIELPEDDEDDSATISPDDKEENEKAADEREERLAKRREREEARKKEAEEREARLLEQVQSAHRVAEESQHRMRELAERQQAFEAARHLEGQVRQMDTDLQTANGVLINARQRAAAARAAGNLQAEQEAFNDEQKANDIRSAIMAHRQQATAQHQQLVQATQRPVGGGQPAQSEGVSDHAKQWMGKHASWFKADGSNAESKVVLDISAQLIRDGYDPSKPAHFRELERALEEKLPNRFKPAQVQRSAARPAVASGSSAPSGGAGAKGKVTLDRLLVANYRAMGYDVTDPAVQKRMLASQQASRAKRGK